MYTLFVLVLDLEREGTYFGINIVYIFDHDTDRNSAVKQVASLRSFRIQSDSDQWHS
jgi:hypothetical protein